MAGLSGIVLAGGQSQRMGRDKAAILLAGRSLLDRAIDLVAPFCEEVIVVGRAEAPRPGVRAVLDEPPGLGPLGGLCTGLAAARARRALCVGIDLPLMTGDLLARLIEAAGDGAAAVFAHGGHLQPLPGVYATSLLPLARGRLAGGRGRMQDFARAAGAAVVPLESSPGHDEAFLNVNTPEALDDARRRLEGRRA